RERPTDLRPGERREPGADGGALAGIPFVPEALGASGLRARRGRVGRAVVHDDHARAVLPGARHHLSHGRLGLVGGDEGGDVGAHRYAASAVWASATLVGVASHPVSPTRT